MGIEFSYVPMVRVGEACWNASVYINTQARGGNEKVLSSENCAEASAVILLHIADDDWLRHFFDCSIKQIEWHIL